MLLDIQSKSKTIKSISTDEFNGNSFTNDIVELIGKENRLNKNRIRITQEKGGVKTPLPLNKQLKTIGLTQDTKLMVKDLGPQIGWRTVFLIEYFGPIIIHSLFFYGLREVYGNIYMSLTNILLYDLTLIHFAKREYETLFVHKFSNGTMPFFNVFKNSSHYWLLNGLNCSFFVYVPRYLIPYEGKIWDFLFHTNDFSGEMCAVFTVLILFFEYSNYLTHKNLSSIRDKNPQNYEIPYGYGFNWVSCPNYFFEVMTFVTFSVFSGNWSYYLFTIVATVQMYIWAVGKHKRYLKTFGDEYKKLNRKAMFPYIL